MKRIFDIVLSTIGLIIVLPFFIIIGLAIIFDSKGGIFYIQKRVGQFNKDFNLLKFRTMGIGASKFGLLTVGNKDSRVTKVGYFLRKYKIDELPQLINVFLGDMSFVGPRPEVRKYVDLYTIEQQEVLSMKPGITDYASIQFRNENELLSKVEDPEKYYIEHIMPEKLKINLIYFKNVSIFTDFKILFLTLRVIFSK